jgi:hypothetical protein
MRPWLCLSLAVIVLMTLNGCNQPGDQQVQSVPQPAPIEQTENPQIPEVEEPVLKEGPVTRLDETGDLSAKEIEWDALIPEDWRPDVLMDQFNADDISDDDPRAQEFLDKLMALWSQAPVVPTLEGQQVKLPGFVVPLEMDAEKIDQFLLVPYYGACIHVPPPPANQTVHVLTREGMAFEGQLFDTVWVTGTMRVERMSSELADAGYRLEDATVEPYE